MRYSPRSHDGGSSADSFRHYVSYGVTSGSTTSCTPTPRMRRGDVVELIDARPPLYPSPPGFAGTSRRCGRTSRRRPGWQAAIHSPGSVRCMCGERCAVSSRPGSRRQRRLVAARSECFSAGILCDEHLGGGSRALMVAPGQGWEERGPRSVASSPLPRLLAGADRGADTAEQRAGPRTWNTRTTNEWGRPMDTVLRGRACTR